MDESKEDYINILRFFKKWIEPFLAIGIFLFLLLIVYGLYQDNDLKTQIAENCGWTNVEEDFKCYCRKNAVDEMESSFMVGTRNIGLMNYTTGEVAYPVFSFENYTD